MQVLKKTIVQLIGRERANRLAAPYHDWQAHRRTREHLRGLAGKDLCVNLGCGPIPLKGWINVDIARAPHVDVVWDLRRGLPFQSSSCTAIFSEHAIEHLSRSDAERLVKECYRVLQPGGVLRLSTPDAGLYLRSYAGDGEFLRHPSFSQAVETPLDRINIMMREDGQHLWVYDAAALLLLLKKAGFATVVEQQFGCSLHQRMNEVDSAVRSFESLYVEAAK